MGVRFSMKSLTYETWDEAKFHNLFRNSFVSGRHLAGDLPAQSFDSQEQDISIFPFHQTCEFGGIISGAYVSSSVDMDGADPSNV